MQPKDFVEKSPENDKKLQRRLDKMAKELAKQKIGINAGKYSFGLIFRYFEVISLKHLKVVFKFYFYTCMYLTITSKVILLFTKLFASLWY